MNTCKKQLIAIQAVMSRST